MPLTHGSLLVGVTVDKSPLPLIDSDGELKNDIGATGHHQKSWKIVC